MFSSLRTKLTIWYVGLLAAVIVVFGWSAYTITVRSLDRDLNNRLEEVSRNFAGDVRAEAEEESSDSRENVIVHSVREAEFRDYKFAVVSPSGKLVASSSGLDTADIPLQTLGFTNITGKNGPLRIYGSSLDLGQDNYRYFVLHSTSELTALENNLLSLFLGSASIALILAGLGGYFLVRRSLAPVVAMSRQAENISASNLNERLTVEHSTDEVGRLGVVINELLARLDASFDQQRRFMADASHELRTPLAIVRGETEVTLSKGDRPLDEYRSSLAIVHDESLRLTKIVEDLFTLARADAGQFQAAFAPVYLDEIVADAVRSIGVLARQKDISVTFSSAGEMPATGDESLLRRLFLNLLDNAVKYNRVGGSVVIKSWLTSNEYTFDVADSGTGIPPLQSTRIFDRFYRVDAARSRSADTLTSGAGLGLSIAQWIAELHFADVRLASSDDTGSIFSVTFDRPLAANGSEGKI